MLPYDKNKIHYVGATCGRPFVYKCNIFSAQDPSLRSRMTRGLFVFYKCNFYLGAGGASHRPTSLYDNVHISVIFSRMKYGVGRNKKYPTKEACLLFGYFLLSPTNLFVVKITRETRTNQAPKVFAELFSKSDHILPQTNYYLSNFSNPCTKPFTSAEQISPPMTLLR